MRVRATWHWKVYARTRGLCETVVLISENTAPVPRYFDSTTAVGNLPALFCVSLGAFANKNKIKSLFNFSDIRCTASGGRCHETVQDFKDEAFLIKFSHYWQYYLLLACYTFWHQFTGSTTFVPTQDVLCPTIVPKRNCTLTITVFSR